MTSPLQQLEQLQAFVMQNPQFIDVERMLCGDLNLSQNILDSITTLRDPIGLNVEVYLENSLLMHRRWSTALAKQVRIKIQPPRLKEGYWSFDIDDLLNAHDYKYVKPECFYLQDEEYLYSAEEGDRPNSVNAYFSVLELIELIEQHDVADHVDSSNHIRCWVLLGNSKKLDIPINFDAASLAENHSSIYQSVQKLRDFFREENKRSDKARLMKAALLDLLEPHDLENRFKALLSILPQVVKRVHDNYELFISDFSFEDEREKLKEKKLEYILKLNDTFSSIQNKLLAIPISLILVGGQMKEPLPGKADVFLANSMILVSALIFSWLMWVLAGNQRNSLDAVQKDYNGRKSRLELELPNLYSELQDMFTALDIRYAKLKRYLLAIKVLVVFGLIFTAAVFYYHTPMQNLADMFTVAISHTKAFTGYILDNLQASLKPITTAVEKK